MPQKPLTTYLLIISLAAFTLAGCHKNTTAQQSSAASPASSGSAYGVNIPGNSISKPIAKSDVKDGLHTIYYKDGLVRAKLYFKNGVKDGECQSFYENGKLWSDEYYTTGLSDGKITVFYDNGQTMYQGQYKMGKPVGKWTYWNKNGKVLHNADYDKLTRNTAL